MSNFKSNSNNYNVLPVKVKNCTEPWIEIWKQSVEQDCNPKDFVIIEPKIGIDPFNDNDISSCKNNELSSKILGNYIAEDTTGENVSEDMPIIINASFFCLRNSSKVKHAKMASYPAAFKLFMNMVSNKIRKNSATPCIIINTKNNSRVAPLNAYAEMVREITAAYVNIFEVYPTIFVAFSDDERLIKEDKSKKDKKKKKKKNNK